MDGAPILGTRGSGCSSGENHFHAGHSRVMQTNALDFTQVGADVVAGAGGI